MRGRILIVLSILFTAISARVNAQSEVASVEKAQALFIYNFSRHIGWPQSSFSSDEFVISVAGSKQLYNEVIRITKDKQVGKYRIVVKLYNSVDEVSSSHMLVFGSNFHGDIDAFKSKLGSFPALLISANESSIADAKGDIVFKMVDQKMKYVLSKNTIKDKGLVLSKQLIDMAFNVM